MALRWYSVVVDCHDVAAQARWWAEALGWQVAYEADDEVVIIPAWAEDAEGEAHDAASFHRFPPGLVFVTVPDGKQVKNRLHIDLAPHTTDDRDAEIRRLLSMGASRVDVGQSADVTWDVLADPEGNEFCVLSSRDG
jgi:hypothetical protein